MSGEHPDPLLLERFMRNDLEAPERTSIVRHLITGCPHCLEITRRFWTLGDEPKGGALDLGGPPRSQLGRFDRLLW